MSTTERTLSEAVEIAAPADAVFAYVDDMKNVGWHMTDRSSMAMVGSKLELQVVSTQQTGLGATYRYSGKVMGLVIDFSETVTAYVRGREKVWHTIGEPKLVIIASYEMRIAVDPLSASTSRLTISIAYELPRAWFLRVIGTLLAGPYSRWCLRQMCRDAKHVLEATALA
jgi:hypothetical protein